MNPWPAMKLLLHNGFRQSQSLAATRVVICADNGTPLAIAVEIAPGHVRFASVQDGDFASQLQQLGLAAPEVTLQ